MKKVVTLIFVILCLLGLCGCSGGNAENVKISEYHSEIYTDEEIKEATNVAIRYFEKEFSGCTLTEITYIGDDKLDSYQEFAERYNADDVIVLISNFNVDGSGGDGSLNPNSTYKNWNWILVRNSGGKWKHVDHGY